MTVPPRSQIDPREAGGRLLARRPDLSAHRSQRRRARQLVESLGHDAAATDVLAGWFGVHLDSDVGDLELALGDRVQVRLAALSREARRAESSEVTRAREALQLGWDQLLDDDARLALRSVAATGDLLLPRRLHEAVVGSAEALTTAEEAGFVLRPQGDDGLWAWPAGAAIDPAFTGEAPTLRLRLAGAALAEPRCGVDDEAVEALEGWLEGAPLHQASLRHRACEAARREGRSEAARTHRLRGLEAVERARPPSPSLRGLLLLDAGLIALQDGGVAEARLAFSEALVDLEAAEDPGIEDLRRHARLLGAQAAALGGDWAEAEGLLEAALLDSPLLSGDARSRTLVAGQAVGQLNLGSLRLVRGQISSALRLLREAGELWEDVADPADPDGASFALALAQGLRAAGRGPELDEPLEAARILSGGDMDRSMRATLPQALHDLGVAAGDRGDWAAAATLLDEASMMGMSLLPPGHPDRGRFAYTRGLLYLAQGDLGAAQRQLDKASDLLGEGHAPETRELIRAALAWTRAREGAHRHGDARRELEEVGAALEALIGSESNAAAHVRLLQESLR